MVCFLGTLRQAMRIYQTGFARFLPVQHPPLFEGVGESEVSAMDRRVVMRFIVLNAPDTD